MNKLLQRQVLKYLGGTDKVPENCIALLAVISEAYDHYEKDRRLTERSIELSSKEMIELNVELKKDKEQLRKAHKELKTLFENIDDALYSVDMVAYKLTQMSKGCEKIYGYTPAEFLADGNLWKNLIHPEDKHLGEQQLLLLSQGKEVFNQYRVLHKNKSIRWVENKILPTLNDGGQLIRIDGITSDISERKQAEIELEKSDAAIKKAYEEKNTVLESIDDGFFAVDKDSLVTYWNRKAEILLGAKKEDIVGKNLHDMFARPDSMVFHDNYQKAIRENSTIHFEGFSTRTNKWFAVSAFASDNGLSVYFKDVTERKTDEEKMQQSELLYRSLNEQATDAICITDASMRFIDVNPYGLEMFLYTKQEALQLSLPDILFAEDLADNPIRLDELKLGKTIRNERRLKRKDGTAVDMEVSTKLMDDGKLIMFGHDITARKKREQVINESEAKFRAFFENSMDGILLTVTDGQILAANPAACEIFRMTEEEIRHKGKYGLIDLSDKRATALIAERQRAGHAKGELTYLRKDGSRFPGEISSVLFTDAFGRERISIIIRDITERKQAEKLLEDSEKRYRSLFEQNLAGVYQSTIDGVMLDCNDAFAKMLKYDSPAELLERNAIDLYFSGAERHKFINNVMSQKRLLNYEAVLKCKDGSALYVLENISLRENDITGETSFDGILIDITENKIAEEGIRNSEEKRRLIMNAALDAIVCMDINGDISFWNPQAETIFGWNENEVIGKRLSDLIIPEQFRKRHEDGMANYLMTGHGPVLNKLLELSAIKRSGEEFPVELSIMPINQGKEKFFCAFIRDITERKKSDKALIKTLEEKNIILESIGDGFFAVDKHWTVTYWNNKAEKMLGTTKGEILGHNLWEVFSDSIDSESYKRYHEAIETNKVIQFEDHYPALGRWYEISAYPSVSGLSVYFKDVTARKKAEEGIQLSNERYDLVTKATSDVIWDWDLLTDKVLRSAEGMEKMFGYTDEKLFGNSSFWTDRIHPEDITELKGGLDLILNSPAEKYLGREYRFKKANGQYAYVYDKGYIVRDEHGKATRMIGACQDVTKLRENELQLLIRAKELTISNEELEQFAYVASHDLQEPLRMVTSFLTQLEKKYGAVIDDKGKQYIDFAVDGAKRMRQIILDLLEFSRAGKIMDDPEKLDLNELVAEIQILSRKQIEEKNATITVNELPHLYAHRSPMRQVFQNLISNALKYASNERPAKITITAKELNDHLQFSVTDNGIGIEEEYFEKIFIIFQRLHNRNEFSGTGMGLAIAKKIIERQGGKIWVRSEYGKGSTFYFTILKK